MDSTAEINRVVFFDGVCNLCNSSVNFLIDRDPKGKFKFASLQSDFAAKCLTEHGIDSTHLVSMVFLAQGKLYRRSRAILEIVRRMRRLWPILYVFILIPGPVRDVLYDWIARNRYRWFGQRESCRMPTPEIMDRFLDT